MDTDEELRRVIPVIKQLAARVKVPISIDTLKPEVAERALEAGASLVNDVGAHREDPSLWRTVARFGAGYVAMHMQGNPRSMQAAPRYDDVVREVDAFLGDRLARLEAMGVGRDHVVLDPGIGFGKTREHNLRLLANLKLFAAHGRPLMLGISRKSLIAQCAGEQDPEGRLPGSLAGAVWGCTQGVQIIRTHDVAATRQALAVAEAILGQVTNATSR